jgi:tetratricopeptide (TPR) repeat protein
LLKAEECFRTAHEKAPDWGMPYGGLAQVWVYRMQMGFSTPSNSIPNIYTHLNSALEIDPNSANSHYIKAAIAVWTEWDWKKGEKEFLKAIELNPNHALSRIFYAHFLMIQHRNEEALEQANYALKLDPLKPFVLAMYAKVLMNDGEFEIAKEYIEKAISIDPDHYMATNALQQFYKVTGDYERWFEVLKKRSKWKNAETLALIENIFNEKGYLATVEEMVKMNEEAEKTGERISYHGQTMDHLQLKNYELAIEYLHKSFEEHNPNLPYASTRRYDSHILKNYPEYVELMKKMRLPIEK